IPESVAISRESKRRDLQVLQRLVTVPNLNAFCQTIELPAIQSRRWTSLSDLIQMPLSECLSLNATTISPIHSSLRTRMANDRKLRLNIAMNSLQDSIALVVKEVEL